MLRQSTSLSFALLIWASVSGQTQLTFSLSEAQTYAAQHNLQIQQQRFDLEIAQSKVRQTTAMGLPQVHAEAGYNNFIDIPTQVALASAFNPLAPPDMLMAFQFGLPQSMNAGITASQLLFDGSYFVGLKASREYLKASEIGVSRSEAEVKNSVAQAYIAALAAQENIRALEDNMKNMDQVFKETSALLEAGFMDQQSADQVKLLRSNVNNQLEFVRRQHQNVTDLLKFQMGIPQSESITLSDNIDQLLSQQTSESVSLLEQPLDVTRHNDYKAVEQGMKLSELSLSSARAKNLPQLAAFFNYGQYAYRNQFDFLSDKRWYPTTIWGLKLSVPIFGSGMRYEGARQARLELAKIQSQKTQLEQSIYMQSMSARNQYKSALERYTTVKADLELARSIKDKTRTKFNAGMAGSTDLTQSEGQYLQTLGNYIGTTMELLNAKIALDKALGN